MWEIWKFTKEISLVNRLIQEVEEEPELGKKKRVEP